MQFPKVAAPVFVIPPAMYEEFSFFPSLTTPVIVCLFGFSHFKCEVVSGF